MPKRYNGGCENYGAIKTSLDGEDYKDIDN